MRNANFLSVAVVFAILLFVNFYAFKAIKTFISNSDNRLKHTVYISFWAIPVIIFLGLIWFFLNRESFDKPQNFSKIYYLSGFFILFYLPQFILVIFHLSEDFLKFLIYLIAKPFSDSTFFAKFSDKIQHIFPLTILGFVLSALTFLSILYGIFIGRFNYEVKKIEISFPNLPPSFDGFQVLQISDFHTGSWYGHEEEMKKAIRYINEQNADIVVFTGDMVNNTASELDSFVSILREINAKIGKYSILGNHDYGDYHEWKNQSEKTKNLEKLAKNYSEMGFRLLRDESVIFSNDSDKIVLLGVENWGRKPFPQRGDLEKAMKNTENIPFKILLSHDPSHWDFEIKEKTNIDLTLSGHTHAMQLAINLGFWKWSPVKWLYPKWQGLYQEGKQFLYVNTGIGFVGIPVRVGCRPEITVFELKRE